MTVPVIIEVGAIEIPAILNDTVTAAAFAEQLPFTVRVSRYEHDYCGSADDLPCDTSQLRDGSSNGDIGYGAGYFSILFSGEDESAVYKDMMIIGHVDEAYLERIAKLDASLTVTVRRT